MKGHIKANQTIGKIWQEVLCILVCLLIIVPIKTMGQGKGISALMDILFPKMEVQAGEIRNGHTVATDLSGTSYSMLSEDKTTLYIFRTAGSVSIGQSYTYTKNGKSYTGTIQGSNFEYGAASIDKSVKKIVFLDDIQPTGSLSFKSSKVTTIEGMKEHFDTSKVTSMYQMFYNCSRLTSLDVSGFDTSKVTYGRYVLLLCQPHFT